jgi:hypothetical protein
LPSATTSVTNTKASLSMPRRVPAATRRRPGAGNPSIRSNTPGAAQAYQSVPSCSSRQRLAAVAVLALLAEMDQMQRHQLVVMAAMDYYGHITILFMLEVAVAE